MLHTALHSRDKSGQLVIIVHGYFSSDKLGPARLYVQIARTLAGIGFDVLRFDFVGFGESDGLMDSVTLESELEDAQIVISQMEKSYQSGIILIGHSFGSNISILLAKRCPSILKIIAISPVCEKNSEYGYLNRDKLRELEQTGLVSRKGFLVNEKFMKALNDAPGVGARNIKIPVTIIRGSEDEFYSSEGANRMARNFPNSRLVEIKGGNHNFLDLGTRTKLLDIIVRELESMHQRQR